ncbi:MAG: DUF1080 domain-containing protein, partial [Armatimonadetes bacterium]|nr:DUF1080 domain-containing protein [Armatimonadota bacterium]
MNCFTRWAVVVICLAVGLMGGYMSWAQQEGRTDEMTAENSTQLAIGDGTDWSFPVGQWAEDEAGVISPPDERNLHSRAFYTAEGYTDLTVEFEFNGNYRANGAGDAGLILRASDAGHFYFVYFPWQGQQLRAKHFWAIIAKVEGDGYLRNIKAVWVPGVPIEVDRWYKVRVEAQGPEISVWVNGRFALSVTDETYKSGCVGLAGYGWYFFRNIRIQGASVDPPVWSDEAQMRAEPMALPVSSQAMPTACMAPNGDVLLGSGESLIRSRDKGRTWDEPEKIIVEIPGTTVTGVSDYGSTMFCTAEGRLFVMFWCDDTPPKIGISESTDDGYTWPEPVPSQVPTEPEWAEIAKPPRGPYGPLVETEDGTLLRFLLSGGGVKVDNPVFDSIHSWGATHCQGFAIRSTDGGESWSAPIELDWPMPGYPFTAERGDLPGSLDFTEPTGVAIGNTVTVLIRPIYSPMMWQCWSYDGGVTWDAAVRATFPGYAQSMIRTSSGAILCAHRFPHYSINVSYDDGVNWDAGTVIDYPSWGMGAMVEV